MVEPRLRYLVLLLSILMIFSEIMFSWLTQNNIGNIRTVEIDLYTTEGIFIHNILQVPRGASDKNPILGLIVIYGSKQSKEWMMAFDIEIAEINFTALTTDAVSYCNFSNFSEWSADRGGTVAIECLAILDYIIKIVLTGHSMDDVIIERTLNITTNPIDVVTFIGWGFQKLTGWVNITYPLKSI